MVQSLAELISHQETTFRDLKLICTNYKKDSATRKNLAYLEERLSRLNKNWEKFVHNHQLLEESGATDLQYFNDDIFNSTKKMYEEALQDMLKRKSELPPPSTSKTEQPPATPNQGEGQSKFTFDDIQFHIPPRGTSESTEKQQDLLRQQYCNFRAIEQHNIKSGRLPQGLSLPVKDIQRDLKNIYDLIHVKARMTNNFMLFEIHIPLLSDEDYKIYRVIPTPILTQGRLKLVQASSSFIAINFLKNSYITMEDQDMRQCTSYGEDEFLCVSRNPVYNMHDKYAPCEAQVFNQQESLSCVLKDVTCKETWIKLHKSNMWLFTLCGKQLMRVICNGQVTPAVIDGTGVISLKSKCLLQKNDATIFTHNQLGSSYNMEPEIEIPTLNSTINNIFDHGWNNAKLNITEQGSPTAVEIRKIDQQLTFQKNREILPKASDMSNHDIYLYSVTSLLLGGITVLALYHIIKRRCKTKKGIKTLSSKTGVTPRGRENFGGDIELQEIHSTAAEPVYSEARQPKKVFHFDELI